MDRKALVRSFKERRPPMGVYRVRNTVTGNSLVAARRDVAAALNRHRAQLRLGGHSSTVFAADWREHGPDSFVFEILDTYEPPADPGFDPTPDLAALEDLWLEKLSLPAGPAPYDRPESPSALTGRGGFAPIRGRR